MIWATNNIEQPGDKPGDCRPRGQLVSWWKLMDIWIEVWASKIHSCLVGKRSTECVWVRWAAPGFSRPGHSCRRSCPDQHVFSREFTFLVPKKHFQRTSVVQTSKTGRPGIDVEIDLPSPSVSPGFPPGDEWLTQRPRAENGTATNGVMTGGEDPRLGFQDLEAMRNWEDKR